MQNLQRSLDLDQDGYDNNEWEKHFIRLVANPDLGITVLKDFFKIGKKEMPQSARLSVGRPLPI